MQERPCVTAEDIYRRYDVTREQAQAIYLRMVENSISELACEAFMTDYQSSRLPDIGPIARAPHTIAAKALAPFFW